MPWWSPSATGSRFLAWFRDYDRIQSLAVLLIYIQIGCSLVGSLGASYNGLLLVNLVVALFALIAIESSSQNLGRAYAVLLVCAILLDIVWFILFSHTIWNMSTGKFGNLFVFSLRLTLWMQIIGFSVRSLSSVLWIQMYRLGVSLVDSSGYQEADFDVRSSFLNPPVHETTRQNSVSNEALGGSIYDPAYYSSLFEDAGDDGLLHEGSRQVGGQGGESPSHAEASQLRSCISKSFHVVNAYSKRCRQPLLSFDGGSEDPSNAI